MSMWDTSTWRSIFDRSPQALSGGQQQSVAYASVLAMEPEVYVYCILPMVMMALVYVLYRTSGYTAKQVGGITKPLVLAFFLFFILNFPFAKPLEGERVFAYLFPGNKCPVTVATISSGFASAIRFIFFIWIADLITSATPTGDIVLYHEQGQAPS